MEKKELVFIPSPGIGHLVSNVEVAKRLIQRDDRLSVTVLIMKMPHDSTVTGYTESLTADSSSRIRFIHLPPDDTNSELFTNPPGNFLSLFIQSHIPKVKEAISELTRSRNSLRLAGFVVDMFCTSMIDVANEFGVPTYVFFTSTAAFLSLMLHFQTLQEKHKVDVTEFKDSGGELVTPGFLNPVPTKVLPSSLVDKNGGSAASLNHARYFRQVKGIIVNTFKELEPHAVESLLSDPTIPNVYPVGPVLNLEGEAQHKQTDIEIMTWLDTQPPSSVVFLCFGSMGSFREDEVKEIADGLESSGHRFLWSLRRPPPKGQFAFPEDYMNPKEALPQGFLDRTAGIGKVIGWAPQMDILAHPAIGGFVSHCGWNSTLESFWFGVPTATWPMYAEQQLNAFELVKELKLAVEIKLDYMKDFRSDRQIVVTAEEIERGIRYLMESDSEVRKNMKETKEKSRKTLMEGGSSYISLGHLIEEMMHDKP